MRRKRFASAHRWRNVVSKPGDNDIAGAQSGFRRQPVPSRQLTELLGKALLDRELCDRLFADPEAIGREFGLLPEEVQAIKRLDRQKIEAAIARLRWG